MALAGEIKVMVRYGEQNAQLPFYVVQGDGPSLLGRDWMEVIRLDWSSICTVARQTKAQYVVAKFPEVFKVGLGHMNTFTATLKLKEGANPRFVRARPVPFALKEVRTRHARKGRDCGKSVPEQLGSSNSTCSQAKWSPKALW